MLRFLEGTSRDQILVEAAEHLTHTRHMMAVNKLLPPGSETLAIARIPHIAGPMAGPMAC